MRRPSPDPDATQSLGRALAACVDARGLVIALEGPLGAGKTVFAKGVAEGMGIDPKRVASPTFTIACEYRAPDGRRLAHVDLYRVESVGELEAAGFLDLLEPGALVLVEWSDRLPQALPADRLVVGISRPDAASEPTARELNAVALGAVSQHILDRWSERTAE